MDVATLVKFDVCCEEHDIDSGKDNTEHVCGRVLALSINMLSLRVQSNTHTHNDAEYMTTCLVCQAGFGIETAKVTKGH